MRLAPLTVLTLPLLACGGGSSAPSPVVAPASSGRHTVTGVLGWDEDGSGGVDPGEVVRFGGVTVRIGDASATTDAAGRFAIDGVGGGRRTLTADLAGLPPYFEVRPADLTVPPAGEVAVPVTLPIGANRLHVYMAFGDSITEGIGSRDGRGYRGALAERLRGKWGRAEVLNHGVRGSRSDEGLLRLGAALAEARPAWTLVQYGTNDWTHECRQTGTCPTLPSLRGMVAQARAAGSLPVLATLLPTNPAYEGAIVEARSAWLEEVNGEIRALAREQGVPLADPHAAFKADRDPARLFVDDLHPSDRGYDLIAEEFFRAITSPRAR